MAQFDRPIDTSVSGDRPVSDVDDIIQETREWVQRCFEAISGYPYETCLIIPSWSGDGQRPSNPKEGMMGWNSSTRKFERWDGSEWSSLEYDAYSCGVTDKSETGWTNKAKTADKATGDQDGNAIKTTYLKKSEVQSFDNNTGKVVRFTSGGRLQFPDGSQIWVST